MPDKSEELEQLKAKIKLLEDKLNSDSSLKEKIQKEETTPLQKIYEWEAPDRVHIKRDKMWFTKVIVIISISVLFAFLTENYMLIVAVLALGFFLYIASSTSPRIVKNAITNKGVMIDDNHKIWDEIDYFWVSERGGELVLNIELKELKGRLILLKGNGDINRIVFEMIKHEKYKEPSGLYSLISTVTEGKRKKLVDFSSSSPTKQQ